MFFDALDKTGQGAVVCVFDITDRLQHMFFRHLDQRHPANRGRDGKHKDVIRTLYIEMDALVGRTMEAAADDDTALFVMSDHGFKPFRRGVDLNAWLLQNGYLKLKVNSQLSKYQVLFIFLILIILNSDFKPIPDYAK